MIAILGSLIGFCGSFIPDILKYFKSKQDNTHEINILKLQIEAQSQLHTQRLEEINTQADVSESESLYKYSKTERTGVRWADASIELFNGTVRPMVTYLFVGLYCSVKISQIYGMVYGSGISIIDAVKYTYTENDFSAMLLCLSYYFGQRMSAKVFKLK
jgi:hypothetical protein